MISIRRKLHARGAVLIEAAFAIPVLAILVMVLLETTRISLLNSVILKTHASSVRELTLAPSWMEAPKESEVCSKLVLRKILGALATFHVPLPESNLNVSVARIGNKIEVTTRATIPCKICLAGHYGIEKIVQTSADMEGETLTCEPDEWKVTP